MANETGNTQLDVLVQELWRGQILQKAYARARAGSRVLNVTGDVSGPGDILHIPIMPTLTVNDEGSDGGLTVQTLTPTEAQLTVNKKKEVTVEFVNNARRQALDSAENSLPGQSGEAIGAQIETDILALQSDITQTAGDGTGRIGKDELLSAMSTFIAADLPIIEMPGEFTFALSDKEYQGLKREGIYSDADKAGFPGNFQARVGDIYGVTTYFTSKVASSGGERKNLAFHREAFGWGIQRNMELRKADGLANLKNTTVYYTGALYGVKTVRTAYAVVLRGIA